ncbi:hypothetical protein HYS94_05155 [Candidatus Daviesbacteria bacterium]|nr:hypothetical protein [Candidatus Daviesbacteria bacterium]
MNKTLVPLAELAELRIEVFPKTKSVSLALSFHQDILDESTAIPMAAGPLTEGAGVGVGVGVGAGVGVGGGLGGLLHQGGIILLAASEIGLGKS